MTESIPKKRLKKRHLSLAVLSFLLLSSLAGYGYLRSDLGHAFLKGQIQSALKSSINGHLEFEIEDGSLLGSLVLKDVSLWNKDRDFVAASPSIEASYGLWGLVTGRLNVDSIRSKNLVFAVENKDGLSNMSDLFLTNPDAEPGRNLQIDLKNINLEDSFFVSFTSTADQSPFVAKKKIDLATLRKMQIEAEGPGKLEGGAGPVILGDLNAKLIVNIDTNGGTNIWVEDLSSKISVDKFLTKQDLSVEPIQLSFFEGEMGLKSGRLKIGEKASTDAIKFRGRFPENESENWFEDHHLEIDGLVLSRGYLRVLSEYQINPKRDPKLNIQSQGALPNKVRYFVEGEVADSKVKSFGEILHLLDEEDIEIDSEVDIPFAQASDFLAIDLKASAGGNLKISGSLGEQTKLKINGSLSKIEALDYHFEKASFDLALANGALSITSFVLQWGEILGELSGKVANDGPFSLSLVANSSGDTKAKINLEAKGVIDWEAQDPLTLVQELEASGDWDLADLDRDKLKIQKSLGTFDLQLRDLSTCKTSTQCYPKDIKLRAQSSGTGLRLNSDSLSGYRVDLDLKSKLGKDQDIETLLGSLTGDFDVDIRSGKLANTRLENTKAKGKVSARGKNRFAYNIDVRSGRVQVEGQDLRKIKANAKGTFQTNAKRDTIRRLNSKGKIKVAAYTDGTNKVGELDGEFDIRKEGRNILGDIEFDTGRSSLAGREFTKLNGAVDIGKGDVFDLSIQGSQEESESVAKKEIEIKAKGSFRNGFQISELDLGDGSYSLKRGLRIEDENLFFDDLELTRGEQKLSVDGSVETGKSQDLKIELDEIQIADISKELGIKAVEPYRGSVSGKVDIGGSASSPDATFNISLRDFYYEEIGPIDVKISGRYGKEKLLLDIIKIDFFNEVTLLGDAEVPLSVHQSGEIEWHFDRPLKSKQKILSFQPSKLVNQLTKNRVLEIAGIAEASLQLSGTMNAPIVDTEWIFENLGASGFVNQMPVELGPFQGRFSAKHRPENKNQPSLSAALQMKSEVGQLLFSAGSKEAIPDMLKQFLTNNTLPSWSDLKFTTSIRTQDFKLENLQVGPLVNANAEGLVGLSADFNGSINNPNVGGKITLNKFGWNRFRDFEFYTAFNFNPKTLNLGGTRLGWDGSQVLNASAQIPNPISLFSEKKKLDESPLHFAIKFVPFSLKKLSTFDYKFAALSGVMKGNISAHGSFRKLKFDSTLTLSDVLYGDGKKGETNLNIRLKDERLSLKGEVLRDGDDAKVSISLPFTQDFSEALSAGVWIKQGPIAGKISSEKTPIAGLMPGAIYKEYVEGLKGYLFSNLVISGTTQNPNFSGTLEIEDAAVTLRQYGRRFEDVGLDVAFEKNVVSIKKIHAEDGTGSIEGEARAVIENWKVKNLLAEFVAKRFSIEGFSSTPAFISALAKVSGDFSNASSRPQIDISRLKVVLPENQNTDALATQLDEDIIIIQNEAEKLSDLSASKASVIDTIYAKLRVKILDGEIIHPIANVEFLGELDIDLANIGALIKGDLKTTQGKVETFGKVFEVQPGIVSFRGLDPPNPFLELEATYKLSKQITDVVGEASSGEARAIVRVTGPVYDSKQQYSADPQMSESDVLYILITDQAPGSAGVGQAEAGLALGAASTGLTGIASMIVGSANKVLPNIAKVDVVRVEAGQSEGKVEVGKYLSRKLFVLYRYRFGSDEDDSQHEVTFEYRFLPAWILDFQVGDADQGEVNLLWDIY